MLAKLSDHAITVMHPDNRRRLGQRRSYLNACYDQLYAKANVLANQGNADWQQIAEQCGNDKKLLQLTKDQMQLEDFKLY